MTTDAEGGETTLSPDDAFALLGNETRVEILKALADAEDPLSFSELRERVGVRDSGQFNYHLDQLSSHFVDDSDTGYQLQRAGERVIEAVLSGAVTEAPVLEPTSIEKACWHCGAPIEVGYRRGLVGMFCTECEGTYGGESPSQQSVVHTGGGRLGYVSLPPAGVHGRTPREVLEAASIWTGADSLTMAKGVCPRCSAPVKHSVHACGDHDASNGRCEQCDRRIATGIEVKCTNCIYNPEAAFIVHLLANPDVRVFLLEHDVDPVTVDRFSLSFDEEIISTSPFEAQFTFQVDAAALTLTVDKDLEVMEAKRHDVSNPD